ncbi:hypothetical protein [Streptomyces sp. NPDC056600]|uniref:hypothetical protein n=1 Tax=Streptomyces sp. NPDC056600 TaxID=3345874 RepID=UPI0036CE0819
MTAAPSRRRAGAARPATRALEDDLRRLLNEWDPIGVADEVADEYDCMLGPLLRRLGGGAGPLEIRGFLRDELEQHFGLDPVRSGPAAMAARVMRWWAAVGEGGDTGSGDTGSGDTGSGDTGSGGTGSGGTGLRRAVRGWWRAAPLSRQRHRRRLRGGSPGILD